MQLLDVQTEFSLPAGGCAIESLVQRAVDCGIDGIAIADRGGAHALDAVGRESRRTGVPIAVGARFDLAGAADVEVLVFPVTAQGAAWLDANVARATALEAAQIPTTPDLSILVQTHGLVPTDPGPVRQLVFRNRSALHLAVPGPYAPELAALGRDLGIPTVFAPSIRIVDAEDAPIQRLLVSIRGDHEGSREAPRSGRPARSLLCGKQHSLTHAAGTPRCEATLRAEHVFGELRRFAAVALEVAGGGARFLIDARSRSVAGGEFAATGLRTQPFELGDVESKICAIVQRRVDATECEAAVSKVRAELLALRKAGVLDAFCNVACRIGELRAAGPICVGASGWDQTWVAWALGVTASPPVLIRESPLGAKPLPELVVELPGASATALREALDGAGAVALASTHRLSRAEADRWLATRCRLDPIARRAAAQLSGNGLPPRPCDLQKLAARLEGRLTALTTDSELRRFGVLTVRIIGSEALSLLQRANAMVTMGDNTPVARSALAALVNGPLAVAYASDLRHFLQLRRPGTVAELARCLALADRTPTAPGCVVRFGTRAFELVFDEDIVRCLSALLSIDEAEARPLATRLVAGATDVLADVRARLTLAMGSSRPARGATRRFISELACALAQLQHRGSYVDRARMLAATAAWLAAEPGEFVNALTQELGQDDRRLSRALSWAARYAYRPCRVPSVRERPEQAADPGDASAGAVRVVHDRATLSARPDNPTANPVLHPDYGGSASWAKTRSRVMEQRVG